MGSGASEKKKYVAPITILQASQKYQEANFWNNVFLFCNVVQKIGKASISPLFTTWQADLMK